MKIQIRPEYSKLEGYFLILKFELKGNQSFHFKVREENTLKHKGFFQEEYSAQLGREFCEFLENNLMKNRSSKNNPGIEFTQEEQDYILNNLHYPTHSKETDMFYNIKEKILNQINERD